MGMADILQKVNRKMKSICPRCIHNEVCMATANQPCFECNHFMEVLRCKDCKHWQDSWVAPDGKHEHGYCHMEDADDVIVGRWDDDFCSYGERRTDERKTD